VDSPGKIAVRRGATRVPVQIWGLSGITPGQLGDGNRRPDFRLNTPFSGRPQFLRPYYYYYLLYE